MPCAQLARKRGMLARKLAKLKRAAAAAAVVVMATVTAQGGGVVVAVVIEMGNKLRTNGVPQKRLQKESGKQSRRPAKLKGERIRCFLLCLIRSVFAEFSLV